MSAADEYARLIEQKRRDREDELLLLLLLICDDARRDTAVMLAHGKSYADVIANDLAPGVNAIARTAALAHADAYRRFGKIAGVTVPRDAAGPLDVLARQYEPGARAAVDAMIASLVQAVADITAKFPDESPKLLAKSAFDNAGYTKDKPRGLDLTAERAVVTASNSGMLGAALLLGERDVMIRHHTVLDGSETDICHDRANLTLPASHPYWINGGVPQLHYGCRSILMPAPPGSEASDWLPTIPPMQGFGFNPLPAWATTRAA